MSKNKKNQPKQANISGVLSVNARGVGYLRSVDKAKPARQLGGEDIEIQNNNLNTALNGDTVSVMLLPSRKNERPAGKVISVEKRAKRVFAGILQKNGNVYYLLPDDKKMYADIIVSKLASALNVAATCQVDDFIGQKVLVKIIQWNKISANPDGEIIQVLGKAGEHNTEMESILYEKGFEINFPEAVEAEAEHLEKTEKPIPYTEVAKRTDFRDTTTFTIDPKDAKDFDDAISIKSLHNGNFEIGVHIADVSHYVREKSQLDAEAVKREFSVYLVDRTIPMLPEVLSNDICSLNPAEEKLTFSAVFEMNGHGKILSRWFGKTIIKSNKRFTYETAQEVLNYGHNRPLTPSLTNEGENMDKNYYFELKTLDEIAKKLRKEKTLHGAIDFEQDEVEFDLDPNGKPVRIYKKQRLDIFDE